MKRHAPPRYRVLAFAPNAWDGQWMNRQQILSRLAHRHAVLYSNGPWTVWDRSRDEFRQAPLLGRFLERDGVWVDVPPKILTQWPRQRAYCRVVDRLLARRWGAKLGTLGAGPVVLYVTHPAFHRVARRIPRDLLVYSPYDMFSTMPDWTPALAQGEQSLLESCDVTIAWSLPTRDALAQRTTREVTYVPNGVDLRLFDPRRAGDPPPDLAALPRPWMGYAGSLNTKVDFALVARLASLQPDWSFVLIGALGSLDPIAEAGLADCRRRHNVHLLGYRERTRVPAYIAALDVGLIPYRTGLWADYGYPNKVNEYLACGRPVVSPELPALREFGSLVDVARTDGEWHGAIARAIDGRGRGSPESRRAAAQRNGWDDRAAMVEDILARHLARKGSADAGGESSAAVDSPSGESALQTARGLTTPGR